MTQFLISTAGAAVDIDDLGLKLSHPTVDRDLAQEFTADELAYSDDLTGAITDGYVTAKIESEDYGVINIDPNEYDTFSLFEQFLPSTEKEEFVTETEIFSGNNDSFVGTLSWPIALSSTTAVTNVVVSNTALFQHWGVAPGDKLGIFGTGTTDGYFTVESVTNQTQLVTVEALLTTNDEGTIAIFHPPGALRVGVDQSTFTNVVGSNVQAALESIDLQLGQGAVGEPNTAANVGVGGVGLFLQKDGYELQFKNINAGSSKITVTNDVANSEVDIDVDPSVIDHQSLSGAGTYTHAQIDVHIDGYANPHNVTAVQVGRDTAQWNANQLQGEPISTTAPQDGYALEYDGYQWAPVSVTSLIEDEHRDLDQLVHEVAEDAFTAYTYVGINITNITSFTDSGQTIKIREEQFTYSGTRVDVAVTIQYNSSGVMVERLTETFTYSGTRVTSVDSVLETF